MKDLFELYMTLQEGTEPPPIFHRWAWMACIGAKLGRRIWFPFGEQRIFPNHYIMFVGDPGSRKSVSIKAACRIIRESGYDKFSASRSSKEKFLMDLAGVSDSANDNVVGARRLKNAKTEVDIFETLALMEVATGGDSKSVREVYINADEFNNFMGNANIEFQSILGELWDWDDEKKPWDYRLKNSQSIQVWQPTISILAGNTPTNFALCFPLATIGQGFMSRLLLIHGEETTIKHTIPPIANKQILEDIYKGLAKLDGLPSGPMRLDPEAYKALDVIYKTWPSLEDPRFRHYSTRRFTHLIKICMTITAARYSTYISKDDVIHANTVLAHAESQMPKALGELGRSKNSEAADKIMQAMYRTKKPMVNKEIFKLVGSDLEKFSDLGHILQSLEESDKIFRVDLPSGERGWLAKAKVISRKLQYIDEKWIRGRELPRM